MTAVDRAERVTVAYAYAHRTGLRGEDLRQKLQDLVTTAIRDAVEEAMCRREKTDAAVKDDAAVIRWMAASPKHLAAVDSEMRRDQQLGLFAAARKAMAARKSSRRI